MSVIYITRVCLIFLSLLVSQEIAWAQAPDYPPPLDVPAAASDRELDAMISEAWEKMFDDQESLRVEQLASGLEQTGIARSDPYLQSRGLARRAWTDLRQRKWNNGAIKKIDHARQLTAVPPTDIDKYTQYAHARAETLLIDAFFKICYRIRNSKTVEDDILEGLALAWQTEDDSLLCFAHIVAFSADVDRDRKVVGFINVKKAEHYAQQSGTSSLIEAARLCELEVYNLLQLTATEMFKNLCRKTQEEFPPQSKVWQVAKKNNPSADEIRQATQKYFKSARAGKLPEDMDVDLAFTVISTYNGEDDQAPERLLLADLLISYFNKNQNTSAALVVGTHKARVLVQLGKYDEYLKFANGYFERLMERKLYTKAENIVVRSIQVCGIHAPEQAEAWWERYRNIRVMQNAAAIPEASNAATIAILHDDSTRLAHELKRQADHGKEEALRHKQLADAEVARRLQELKTSRLTGILWGTATCLSVLVGITSVILVRNRTLRNRQEELETEINQRVLAEQRLREVQREIVRQQRLHALGEMAAGIAHDINNVLSPIGIYSDLLAGDAQRGREEVQSFAKSIGQCVADASLLIRRLHPFYRKAHTERSEVDVAQVIHAVAENTRRQNEGRNLIVRCETQPGTFRLSSADLREILINLANNAVDAMDGKGVLTLRNRIDPDFLELEVEDNGCGMTEEVLQRCLHPFFSTKSNGGSGLGLATTLAVVESYNGAIDIDTKLGCGTRIRVSIPYGEQSLPEYDDLLWNNAERSFRILLVDDNQTTLESTQLLLESLGHSVKSCEAEQALDMLQREPFDILLTDYRMHAINGYELCKLVRKEMPQIATIIMSGYEEPGIREGCDAFLPKPISTSSLKDALFKSVVSRADFASSKSS